MKKNIVVAVTLVAIGFAFGFGLKLLMWLLIIVGVAAGVAWSLTAGGKLGEDDVEEVFPDPRPEGTPDVRHQWRGNSAKAPHAK
ncbi:hypothetical protein [Cupriavidus pauculus]|uniref:Uncharacterized protein n=1 Tax=Cupriavidus pauculus TaxID=82633 RepID=A0A3G8H3R5_9BURK|nr:hypothetical protein [Cupriavidus pauculus]AZG14959.1 hypothetical protein EHF44_16890 [Cupriavidus pauculus]